jgi:hypothetical protein
MMCMVPNCPEPIERVRDGLCGFHRAREEAARAQADWQHEQDWREYLEDQGVLVDPPKPVRVTYPPTALAPATSWRDSDGSAYGLAALRGVMEDLARECQPGNRNNALSRAAFRLGQVVAAGHLRLDVAVEHLRMVAERAALPRREWDGRHGLIRKGLDKGAQRPVEPRSIAA